MQESTRRDPGSYICPGRGVGMEAPYPPSPSRICTWLCGVCRYLSPVRDAGLSCELGNRTPALPAMHQEVGRHCPHGPAGCARLRDDYLLHPSVQQIDLPIRALDARIDLAQFASEVVGLRTQLGDG